MMGNRVRRAAGIAALLIAAATLLACPGARAAVPEAKGLPGAAMRGDLAEVRRLVDAGADLEEEFQGVSPLYLAAARRHRDVADFLIARGARVEHRHQPNNHSALMHIAGNGWLETARRAIELGADVNAADIVRETPLALAARGGHVPVVKLLLSKGARVDSSSKWHRTALGDAAFAGRADIARLLISRGAKLNPAGTGESPLQVAVRCRRREVALLLLEKGAVPDDTDVWGRPLVRVAREGGMEDVAAAIAARLARGGGRGASGTYPLHRLAADGEDREIAVLLAGKVPVDGRDNNGLTPLMIASARGRASTAALLVDGGADVNARAGPPSEHAGWAPLDFAVDKYRLPVAQLLIERGADVRRSAAAGQLLSWHAANGEDAKVALLLDRKAPVDGPDRYGRTPLMAAASAGKVSTVSLLLDRGAKIDARVSGDRGPRAPLEEGKTALFYAAENGWLPVVELLASRGADTGAFRRYGDSMLMRAVAFGRPPVVRALVAHGADVNAETGSGIKALSIALDRDDLESAKILADAGARFDGKAFGKPYLAIAMDAGKDNVAAFLIEHGAGLDRRGLGGTPLYIAARDGKTDLAERLVRKGARPDERGDDAGNTALIVAAGKGRLDIVRVLVAGGAKVNVTNDRGDTALSAATKNGHGAVAAYLVSKGGVPGIPLRRVIDRAIPR